MLYVGIDVAKYKHDLAIIDDEGTIHIRHLQIKNNSEGFAKLHTTLQNLVTITGDKIQVGLEDTGHYCINLVSFLRTKTYPTFSYNPLLIKDYAKSITLRKTKTDKKDAMTIARKLREDFDKHQFQPDSLMIELKYATRHVSRLKQNCSKQKLNYTRILDIIFPELARFLGGPSAKHNAYVYRLLKTFPSPRLLANANLTKLTNLLSKDPDGKHGKTFAKELRELARQSIGQDSHSLEFELLQTIDTIEFFSSKREEAEKQVSSLMQQITSPLLTVPGIGPVLGSIILAETRSIDYFKTPAQLLAYAGAEPSINTSGEYQIDQGHMVKRGSSNLRWALHQAARLSAQWSPKMKQYLQKKLDEGKHFNVAISHVAKKLVRIIFYMLKHNVPWDEEKVIIN